MTGTESVPILVVTTDEDLAATLSDGLRILGHVPLVALTTGDAFDRTRRQEIDVLLLDLVRADGGRHALPRRIGEADLATETIVIAPPTTSPPRSRPCAAAPTTSWSARPRWTSSACA